MRDPKFQKNSPFATKLVQCTLPSVCVKKLKTSLKSNQNSEICLRGINGLKYIIYTYMANANENQK